MVLKKTTAQQAYSHMTPDGRFLVFHTNYGRRIRSTWYLIDTESPTDKYTHHYMGNGQAVFGHLTSHTSLATIRRYINRIVEVVS
jgi:hypothetical protein